MLLLALAAPANGAIELQGLHAYPDRESVPAGETIRFHVSSRVPYRFGVSKLGLRVDDRTSDETIFLAGKVSPARVQPIHPGSFVRVKNGLPADAELTALTLECWVRPWKLSQWQGILTQHDYPDRCGFGLYAVKAPTHLFFNKPEQVGFADRVVFGGAKSGHRRACGHEGDIRLSSYAPPTGPVPAGAFLPKEPAGIETIASLQRDNARVLDYFARFGQQKTGTLVDMIYWERPQGGTVFNAGAIGFGWALDADPKLTKLLRNVLHHLAGVTARTPYDPEWLDPPK